MHKQLRVQWFFAIMLILALAFSMIACSGTARNSGDPGYEARIITIEGLNFDQNTDVSLTEISVAELRKLPQHDLDGSYKRTTGLSEEFKMSGPYLSEVIGHLGGKLEDYAGIGVVGRDGYYCLLSQEIIAATPDLMLAVVIDGEAKLDEDNAPARLAVQGQFGPYWVKQVEKIILYKEIPEKNITSVWVFKNLAAGIEPYKYEYYGSKDDAIDLEQVFSRLDQVDNKAFFTMKSSDGFKKNEVINMVKSRYFIKVEGEDAPTNVSPYIKLGMNVQNIAWISTNADAAVFPEKMMEYMDLAEIEGHKGISLQELLYETEVKAVKSESFDILGTQGEKITVAGADMSQGILVMQADGRASVIWPRTAGYQNIYDLLRIRLAEKQPEGEASEADQKESSRTSADAGDGSSTTAAAESDTPDADTILTITGDAVDKPVYLSMEDLKQMQIAYVEQSFSSVNNYPTRKFVVGKGVNLLYLLEQAGMKSSAKSILIEAADGYKAALTRDQLLEQRYRYPNLLSGSNAKPEEVKPMLAWAFREGQDFSQAREDGQLRLLIGQKGINNVNTAVSVQMVSKISISSRDNGSWDHPRAILENGRITLYHDYMDQVKLYYTLDGSQPCENSAIYNPSTSYFQPDLIRPITVSGSGTLKVKVIGFGKRDSEVLSYAY